MRLGLDLVQMVRFLMTLAHDRERRNLCNGAVFGCIRAVGKPKIGRHSALERLLRFQGTLVGSFEGKVVHIAAGKVLLR
jgi:hypothetical protein